MEARTCPRCHEPVTYPPPGGTGSCPHCDCVLIGDPSSVDKEMLGDETAGKPLPRAPHVGIADMTARIEQLTQSKQTVLNTLAELIPTGPADQRPSQLEQRLAELNRELNEARGRLTEYNLQQEGLN